MTDTRPTRRYYSVTATAAIALEAHADGRRITAAVAEHYGINHDTARRQVRRARRAGFDIPTDAPHNATTAARPRTSDERMNAQWALCCDQCEFACHLDEMAALVAHTRTFHSARRPTISERTPRRIDTAA